MKVLLVGGTWVEDTREEKPHYSKIVDTARKRLVTMGHRVTVFNGGEHSDLEALLYVAKNFDIVFWWPNVVDNELEKFRNIKEFAPHIMLVTSKRNDNNKYNFMQLTQHALALKANLTFEFAKNDSDEDGKFNIRVFDPLGCVWYEGKDMSDAIVYAMERLVYLNSITRQKTIQSTTDKNLVLAWYFDQFKQEQYPSERSVEVPDERRFVEIVRKHAETFYEIMSPGKDVQRFLGNASMKPTPPQVGRCSRGMPSFKSGDYVFVSQRNIDKQFIDLEHFVPCYMEDGKLYYCGENKPSVDTPIQIRLYEAIPHVKYIIHSHCYIQGAKFTSKCIPCGAIEEVDEVLKLIPEIDAEFQKEYETKDRAPGYKINLKGHGSLVITSDLDALDLIKYYGRDLPEVMF